MERIMFESLKKRIVYRSKNKEDWEKAQELLNEANISHYAWVSEEPPVGGCGSKLDIRTFASTKKLPKLMYSIEVHKDLEKDAMNILKDQVLPPRSYGVAL